MTRDEGAVAVAWPTTSPCCNATVEAQESRAHVRPICAKCEKPLGKWQQ